MTLPEWKDRRVERENTYKVLNNKDGTITLMPVTGEIYEPGTPLNALNLNKINSQLSEKVQKEAGKGLSTNDYTNNEKSKLSEALAKANNPLAALELAGYKVPLNMLSEEVISAITGETQITTANGLENNKGVDYPYINIPRDGQLYQTTQYLKDLFLDIKIIGAKKGKLYKIEWLGNGYTGFGEPTYGFNLYEYEEKEYNINSEIGKKIILNRTETDIPNPTETIVTRVHTSIKDNLTIVFTYDRGNFPIKGFWSSGDMFDRGCVISKNCYIYIDEAPKKIALKKVDNKVLVKYRYNTEKSIVIELNELGINQIIHFKKVGYVNEKDLTDNFDYTLDYEIKSDWISPYGIKAVNNALNDNDVTTGGNHGTDGSGGFRTARPISLKVSYDGDNLLKNNETIFCDTARIIVKNNIMAGNTINTETGDGRYCVEETVTYNVKNESFYITVELEALEDVKLIKYTGIQATKQNYTDFYFMDSENPQWLATSTSRTEFALKTSNLKCDRFVLRKGKDLLIGWLDTEVGIGNGEYISSSSYKGLWSGIKAYLHCIKNKELTIKKSEVVFYAGGYTFQESSSDKVCLYKINNKGELIYISDTFESSLTYLNLIDSKGLKTKTLENENATISNIKLSQGFQFKSNASGFVKFVVV